jgi:hypothetical protein
MTRINRRNFVDVCQLWKRWSIERFRVDCRRLLTGCSSRSFLYKATSSRDDRGGGSANKKIAQLTKSFLSLILYSTPHPISWYTLIPLIGSRTFQRPTFLAEISFLLLIFFLVLYSSFCYVVLPRAALVVVDRSVMLILPFLGIVLAYLRSCN